GLPDRPRVHRRVVPTLGAEAEPDEDPEPVRFQGEQRRDAGEQQDLVRAGIADPRISFERLSSLADRLLQLRPEVAAAVLLRDLRDVPQLLRPLLGVHAAELRDPGQGARGGLQEVSGRGAGLPLARAERLRPLRVVDEIGDVLPEHEVEGVFRRRRRGRAELGAETLEDLPQGGPIGHGRGRTRMFRYATGPWSPW